MRKALFKRLDLASDKIFMQSDDGMYAINISKDEMPNILHGLCDLITKDLAVILRTHIADMKDNTDAFSADMVEDMRAMLAEIKNDKESIKESFSDENIAEIMEDIPEFRAKVYAGMSKDKEKAWSGLEMVIEGDESPWDFSFDVTLMKADEDELMISTPKIFADAESEE